MKAITYTAARQNLAKMMDMVCNDHTPLIVTRKTTDSVVIISLADYEALEETGYLLRSPKNTRRLIESIARLEAGQGSEQYPYRVDSLRLSQPNGDQSSSFKKTAQEVSDYRHFVIG